MKWIAALLLALLLPALAACGSDPQRTSGAGASSAPRATTSPTPSAGTPATASPPTASAAKPSPTLTAPVSQSPPADALDLTGADLPQFVNRAQDITCLFEDFEGVQVRCDVMGAQWKVQKPGTCQEAYGDSATLGAAALLTCHGDTIFSPDVTQVVGPGKAVRFHAFTCTVATDAVSCTNGKGHGFTVAKKTYALS